MLTVHKHTHMHIPAGTEKPNFLMSHSTSFMSVHPVPGSLKLSCHVSPSGEQVDACMAQLLFLIFTRQTCARKLCVYVLLSHIQESRKSIYRAAGVRRGGNRFLTGVAPLLPSAMEELKHLVFIIGRSGVGGGQRKREEEGEWR